MEKENQSSFILDESTQHSTMLNMLINTVTCSINLLIFIALVAHARAAGNETDKIVGGTAADPADYRGYAIPSRQSGARYLCGAYLIRNDILVTAAHCRIAFEGYDVYIGGAERLGSDALETIATGDVCEHPGYNENAIFSSPFANDIMLIRLQTPSNQLIKEYYTVGYHIAKLIPRLVTRKKVNRIAFSTPSGRLLDISFFATSHPLFLPPALPSGLVEQVMVVPYQTSY
jgi:hypothetical protein